LDLGDLVLRVKSIANSPSAKLIHVVDTDDSKATKMSRDTQTGGKAFKRKVLEEVALTLTVKRYAFDVELLTAINARGYRIIEAPALYPIMLSKVQSVKSSECS
jgi:hypothetical protein